MNETETTAATTPNRNTLVLLIITLTVGLVLIFGTYATFLVLVASK